MSDQKDEKKPDKILTFPHLVSRELICTLIVVGVFSIFSIYFNAPLEDAPSPTRMPSPTKAPWYFLGLQELLVYFDPWFAGVMVPAIIILGLMAIPYVDVNPEGVGKFEYSKRKLAITFFSAGVILWFVLIIIGEFFRGPSWLWYWPWESWEIHKEFPAAAWNIPSTIGFLLIILYLGAGFIIPVIMKKEFYHKLGFINYCIVMSFILASVSVVLKIVLRLVFNIKYVLQTPWFNI